MKKVMLLIAFVGSALVLTGCGVVNSNTTMVRPTGDVITEIFEVDDFTNFSIGGAFDVTFRYAEDHEIQIEMAENLFDYIEVSVSRGALSIRIRSGVGINFGNHQPQITIYAPFIDSVTLSGSTTATDWDTITASSFSIETSGSSQMVIEVSAEELNIAASGSADITADLTTDELNITASGSSSIELAGVASIIDLNLSGSNTISAFELQAEEVEIQASGSTQVEIAVSEQLNVIARGSSRVQYIGNPVVTQETSGSATIGPRE